MQGDPVTRPTASALPLPRLHVDEADPEHLNCCVAGSFIHVSKEKLHLRSIPCAPCACLRRCCCCFPHARQDERRAPAPRLGRLVVQVRVENTDAPPVVATTRAATSSSAPIRSSSGRGRAPQRHGQRHAR